MSELELSQTIEALLVERNPRGMAAARRALEPGYYLRAARLLNRAGGTVLIGTGFPVADTFETDGPVGTIALYDCLQRLGANPVIVCGKPLSGLLQSRYQVHEISVGRGAEREREAGAALAHYQPELVISIERPGLSGCGAYFNMHGEDISDRCACFDYFVNLCDCPSIGIGDGGNEIGMGNIRETIEKLEVVAAATCCDELLVADVSNWGAYGIMAIIGYWRGEDLLGHFLPLKTLAFLTAGGGVDGVTGENTATEDGLYPAACVALIEQLRQLTGYGDPA